MMDEAMGEHDHDQAHNQVLGKDGGADNGAASSIEAGPVRADVLEKTAVALHYNHTEAPKVVAKGRGIIAEKIIEAAREHGVFIQEDPLLAEALGAVELDDEIPVELYLAVAEIIGFVLSLKKQAAT